MVSKMNLKLKRIIPDFDYRGYEALAYELYDSIYPHKPIKVYTAYHKAACMLYREILDKKYNSQCRFFIRTIYCDTIKHVTLYTCKKGNV